METSQLSKRNVPKSISSNSSSVEKQESTANKDNKPPVTNKKAKSSSSSSSRKGGKNSSESTFGVFGLVFRIASSLILLNLCLSYLLTESWTWGVENKWTNWRNYIPRKHVVLTLEELKKYDGSDPNLPIYISINGELYDVSEGRTFYGPGGSYHLFAGKDSARAFGTSCLSRQDHLTHDTRGLDDGQLQSLKGWQKYYENHHTYYKAGYVLLPEIDPKSPIPPECKGAVPKPN